MTEAKRKNKNNFWGYNGMKRFCTFFRICYQWLFGCFDSKAFVLILCSVANLLYLHSYMYRAGFLEWTFMYSIPASICSVFFDVFFLLVVFLLLSKKKLKPALALTYGLTLIWTLISTFYARFFYCYMPLTAVGQAGGLEDDTVIGTIFSGVQWSDLFFVFSPILFFLLYRRTKKTKIQLYSVLRLLVVLLLSLLIPLFVYSLYHFSQARYRNNWELYGFRIKELLFDVNRGGTPQLSRFQAGCLRTAAYELYDLFYVLELTPEQRQEILAFYSDYSERTTSHEKNPNIRNVVFVLLESFLSAPIELVVDGKEITPYLNSLVKDSTVFYNGKMKANIACGESGDGQFIYMNGMLPLRYKMTVGVVKHNKLHALPRYCATEMNIGHSEIIVPTRPNMWQQADVNVAYGITTMFSQDDIQGKNGSSLDDESIFNFAAESAKKAKDPFFTMILSMSTHSPYSEYMGDNILDGCTSLPKEYQNYLNTCHYTDQQLHKYIDALKEKNLYDSTLIVIAADHHAHLERLQMGGKISTHIPLFIINGNINGNSAWHGEFNQLDVYTTILDILGINGEWLGLGHSLLLPYYHNSVTERAYQISEWMIEGNYFNESSD